MERPKRTMALIERLFAPRDIAGIVFFRITLGLVLALQPVYMLAKGQVDYFYVWPRVFFPHPGFGWLPAASDTVVYWSIGIMLVSGLLIAVGCFYRLAALAYSLSWGYLFFLESTTYHNQHYLIFLLAVLFFIVPSHRACSVDALWRRSLRSQTVPAWAYWILRFQIAMPFIFGGLIKLQPDWLAGRPGVYIWLSGVAARPWYGVLDPEMMSLVIAYGGVFVDLLAVPLLLYRRTRVVGYLMTLGFHIANISIMGGTPLHLWMFPWLMIPGGTIFFEPDWPKRAWGRIRGRNTGGQAPATGFGASSFGSSSDTSLKFWQPALIPILGLYVLIQLVLPLRHYAYPGPVIWNGEGSFYAWNMILALKFGTARIEVTDPSTGETFNHNPETILSPYQALVMSKRPDMMWTYARILSESYERRGRPGVEIRFVTQTSLNGRPYQRYLDPELDLLQVPTLRDLQAHILPLKYPLPPLAEAVRDAAAFGYGTRNRSSEGITSPDS